jgi:hypothetical protein
MNKKIKSCYYEVDGKRKLVEDNSAVLLEIGKDHKFYVDFETNENFDDKVLSKKETIKSQVKWAYILQYSFSKLSKEKKEEDVWGFFIKGNGTTPIEKYGIDKNYIQESEIIFSPKSSKNSFWEGNAYQLLVFIDHPDDGISFPFMPVKAAPEIRVAYFDKQKIIENSSEFSINDGFYNYNTLIRLYLSTHMLPLKSLPHARNIISEGINFNLDDKWEDINLIVELLDEKNDTQTFASTTKRDYSCGDNYKFILDEPIINGDLSKYIENQSSLSANTSFVVPISIELDWKDKFHKKHKEQPTKKYYVMVVIENKKTETRYFYYPTDIEWYRTEKNKIERIPTSHFFAVKYNSNEYIIAENERKKNNMIQYIGDIEYSQKENNPCAFSVITVDDGDKKIEVFNEFNLGPKVNDNTKRYVDIICGDEAVKKIKVEAKFIQEKGGNKEAVRTHKNGFKCNKILNDGKKHNGLEDVFKMGWIVGQYVPSKDPKAFFEKYYKMLNIAKRPSFFHPSNSANAPKFKSDQEAKGVAVSEEEQNQYKGITVANIQGLAESDYKIDEKSDSITVNLKYNYNKSYDNEILNYLAHDQKVFLLNELGEAVSNIWVFRYLLKLIKKEDLYQTFFVPVTTCRYPNQIAQIRIFPDMKWVLNFNFNIEDPIFYKETTTKLEYFDRSNNEFDDLSGNIRRANESAEKKRESSLSHLSKTKFGLSLICEAGGSEPIEVSKAFSEKIRNTFGPIFTVIDFLDNLLGISKAKEEDHAQSSNPNYVKRKGLRTLPISFEIKPPSLGLGIGIGYETTANRNISWGIEGRIIANPIIGADVRLDLLALGSKIKPWGIILDVLEISAWAAETLSGGNLKVDYAIDIVVESNISLVGKEIGVNTETKERIFEKYGNIKYIFNDKKTIGDFSFQGKISSHIELSAKIQWKTKITKYNTKAQTVNNSISIGAKAESSLTITVPTELNSDGNLNVSCHFSGVIFEAWFKISSSISRDEDENEGEAEVGKPDISEKLISEQPFDFPINF